MTTYEFNTDHAETEGWTISETSDETRCYQLQKLDSLNVFTDDSRAWEYVVKKADAGSKYHFEALKYLEGCSPAEYQDILKYTAKED